MTNRRVQKTIAGVCRGVKVMAAIAVVWFGGLAAQAQSSDLLSDRFTSLVAQIRPSIAAVGSYYFKDTPTVQYFGTGFVIDDGLAVVTNAHVVDAVNKVNKLAYLRVFFPDDKPVDGRKAQVWAYDRFHDLAILRFEAPQAPTLQMISTRIPAAGYSVAVMGYPIGAKLGLVPAVHKGIVSAVVPAVLPLPSGAKMTPQLAEAIRQPYNLYQLDLVVFPGNSGSPLFDVSTGGVLGIINKTLAAKTREHLLTDPSGVSYAVPSRWIRELLNRADAMSESDRKEELKRLGLLGV
jgi:S1-C subfamily serine protease